MEGNMNLTLKVWRQKNTNTEGNFENYDVQGISEDMSFLEMFDVLNERLINDGKEPIAFDHDCREGICGMCSMYINGSPHIQTVV
jgi:succinate dehydrogenase / fumarate reductase iron-sulfur subunit